MKQSIWATAMRCGNEVITSNPTLPHGATMDRRDAAGNWVVVSNPTLPHGATMECRPAAWRMARYFVVVLAALVIVICSAKESHAYWQQHVSYDIHVTLIDSIHTLDGNLSVVYTNNSPDTLREVFFHLYANAFQPGSMMDERALEIHTAPVYDRIHKLPESEWGKYWIDRVWVGTQAAKFDITGTIMRVVLYQPLLPGGQVKIELPFREQIPKQIRRSGWMSADGVEYSMSQWYPKVCEYDFEGWHHQE
ncbi:MAG: hypothetical protein ACHQNE_08260, partial [Candidatus Kapaibacterium sp.]